MSYSTLNTCRFCKSSMTHASELVKYGTRHYAHPRCYIERRVKEGRDPFADLPLYQLEQMPYFLLKEFGLVEACAGQIEHLKARIAAFVAARPLTNDELIAIIRKGEE